MKTIIIKKSRASLMVSALILLVFISTIILLLTTYAANNLKHAKIQEEGLHAYYLAYSGCEIAYQALMKEADPSPSTGGAGVNNWELLAQKFVSPSAAFLDRHKVCVSYDGTKTEAGYNNKAKFELSKPGTSGQPLSQLLAELEDSLILIEVTRVPDSTSVEEEQPYKGYIRIKSQAKTNLSSAFPGVATKYLYIDSKNKGKFFWR